MERVGTERERGTEHPAQWREDALPEGVGAPQEGGGAAPVRQSEAPDGHPTRQATIPPLVLAVALAALAVPVLWAFGYLSGGAPGARLVWPAALFSLLLAAAVTGYWLARHSS